MIEVVELSPSTEPEYTRFVESIPEAMVYYSLAYRDFLQQTAGGTPRYQVALSGGRAVGVLPYFVGVHPVYGDIINSLPWYGSYGGCLVAPDADPSVRRMLLESFSQKINARTTAFATLIMSPHEHRHLSEYTDIIRAQATDGRIGQFTRLPQLTSGAEQALQQVLLQKTRNLVRKSLRQGFTCEETDATDAWEFLHATHTDNISALGGRAKPWEHFLALRRSIPPAFRQLWLARSEGVPIAGLLLLRFNQTVEYLTPVIKQEWRPRQPLSFLIWHAMLDAIRAGYALWNWGGTWFSQTGLHHFKAGWGAVDLPYTYLVTARPDAREAYAAAPDSVRGVCPYYFIYPHAALAN